MLRLARSMFAMADDDDSGEVSREEFTKWASSHLMSNRLLRAFNKAKKTSAGESQAPGQPGGGVRAASGSGAGSGQQVRALHRAHSSKFRAAAKAARVTKNHKAKMLNKIATEQAMEQLTQVTAFDLGEVKRLRQVFGAVLAGMWPVAGDEGCTPGPHRPWCRQLLSCDIDVSPSPVVRA